MDTFLKCHLVCRHIKDVEDLLGLFTLCLATYTSLAPTSQEPVVCFGQTSFWFGQPKSLNIPSTPLHLSGSQNAAWKDDYLAYELSPKHQKPSRNLLLITSLIFWITNLGPWSLQFLSLECLHAPDVILTDPEYSGLSLIKDKTDHSLKSPLMCIYPPTFCYSLSGGTDLIGPNQSLGIKSKNWPWKKRSFPLTKI